MNLEFHKRKMRQLQEELTSAEVWERELEVRLRKIEEKVRPPLMKFCDQLEKEEGVEQEVVEESLVSNDWEKVVGFIRKRVVKVEQMNRSQLVGLVRTELGVRNCRVESERQEGRPCKRWPAPY